MRLFNFLKKLFLRDALLSVCIIFAGLSMLAVPPDAGYFSYFDARVLCLLFCLMAVVLGFQECGVFAVLSQRLLKSCNRFPVLCLVLVLLPFFCAMLVTNDVALITFVPFTILVFGQIGRNDKLVRIIVLQTVAANLGSMATPVGNPQNLFLYAFYTLDAKAFFTVVMPLVMTSLAALSMLALCVKNDAVQVCFDSQSTLCHPRRLAVYITLFALCLLTVFRFFPYPFLTAIVIVSLLILSPALLKKVDYSLLLTFVCFFLFAGNMGRMPQIRQILSALLEQNTLLSAIAASQIISNVPAAVLLSNFTADWRGLLLGVNIGGLGTPIASLASLISLKFYLRADHAKPMRYLWIFTLYNIGGLLLLIWVARLF
ncbi:MAG: citrate transporter [Oscillospiraceae bacterium]|jgi:Na+/H+ antiporter NhaD/arsenite permease-like protein|nr:citrate transporter [Oscillospiraceae bacterium]